MNGRAPDSNSLEVRAMKAYILWVGQGVEKGKKPVGTGLEPLAFLERAADYGKGRIVYLEKCQRCHGSDGQGKPDSLNPGINIRRSGENTVTIRRPAYTDYLSLLLLSRPICPLEPAMNRNN